MQMEMIENNEGTALETTVARLAAAASLLEQAMERLNERQQSAEATIGRISATVESALEERLAAAESKIAELTAAATTTVPSTVTNTRKTLPASMATMLAKAGITADSGYIASIVSAVVAILNVQQAQAPAAKA